MGRSRCSCDAYRVPGRPFLVLSRQSRRRNGILSCCRQLLSAKHGVVGNLDILHKFEPIMWRFSTAGRCSPTARCRPGTVDEAGNPSSPDGSTSTDHYGNNKSGAGTGSTHSRPDGLANCDRHRHSKSNYRVSGRIDTGSNQDPRQRLRGAPAQCRLRRSSTQCRLCRTTG
jgi:hypothetical protein